MDEEKFFIRELSLLEFNRRVVAQATDKTLPIQERLNYLCIADSNLDEFFEIKVTSKFLDSSIAAVIPAAPLPMMSTSVLINFFEN